MPENGLGKVIVVRKFDAPRSDVWKLWVTPESVMKWWGPKGFTSPIVELDAHKGGKFLLCMRGAGFDGAVRDYYNAGDFEEMQHEQRIVMVMRFSDEKGMTVPASYYGLPGKWPTETRVTATFADAGPNGTLLTINEEGTPIDMLSPSTQGWTEQLDKMEEALGVGRPQTITTSLLFVGEQAGKAEEAMHLYTSLFDGSKILMVARYIPGDGDTVGWIKFGSFRLAGQTFNAMDSGLPHKFSFTPAVNLFVTCKSEDEFERLDAELSKGGSYLMKKGSYPFAEKYCWLSDRYGINWQLSYRGSATT